MEKNALYRELDVYSDGASRGNPGKASCGFVIFLSKSKQQLLRQGTYLGKKTNNQAEYAGVILAIRKAKEYQPKKIHCYLDSELIVKQLHGIYKVKDIEMKRLFALVVAEMSETEIEFTHILRAYNKEADAMANLALDKGEKEGDTFLYTTYNE